MESRLRKTLYLSLYTHMLHIHVLAYICIYPTERKPARLTRTSSNSSIGTQHEKIKSTNANKYLLRRHGKRRNANQPNSRQAPAAKNIDDVICAQRSKGKRRNANQPNSRRETKKQKNGQRNTKKSKAKTQTNIYVHNEETENDGTQTSPTHDKRQ